MKGTSEMEGAGALPGETPRAELNRRSFPWDLGILTVCGGLLCWFLLLDFSKTSFTPGLEESWIATLTYAAEHRLQFGSDIIFTYGPLAHFVVSVYSPHLYGIDFVAQLILKAGYVILLILLSRRLSVTRSLLVFVVGLAAGLISWQAMYLFVVAASGCVLCGDTRLDRWLSAPVLGLAVTLALVKATFLFYGIFVLTVVSMFWLFKRAPKQALWRATGFGLFFLIGWLSCGQSLSNLPAFIRGSLEITSGYSRVMSLPAPPHVLVLGLIGAALAVLQLLQLWWRSRDRRADGLQGLMLLAALFLAWKLGFARADLHVLEYFYCLALVSAAAPAFFRPARQTISPDWLLTLAVIGLSVGAIISQSPGIPAQIVAVARIHWRQNKQVLMHPTAYSAVLKEEVVANRKTFALPKIRAAVGSGSVNVFGVQQAVLPLNGMNYHPSPVIQSYCSYTPALTQAQVAFYRGPGAPAFVLFKMPTIDMQFPSLVDAGVLRELVENYDPVLDEQGYLLLRRKDMPAFTEQLKLLAENTADIGQPVHVPPGMVWCEMEMRETLLGRLLDFLYHQPEVRMETRLGAGSAPTNWRLAPAIAKTGFIVNPLLTDPEDFVQLAAGRSGAQIDSLRIVPSPEADRWFKPQVSYRFYALPELRAPAAAQEFLREEEAYGDIFDLPPTKVLTPAPLRRFDDEGRSFLMIHPDGEMRFNIPENVTTLRAKYAIEPAAFQEGKTDGVEFRVEAASANHPDTVLFDRLLAPLTVPADRAVQQLEVTLPSHAQGDQIIFRTLPGPAANRAWDWAGWSDVRFGP